MIETLIRRPLRQAVFFVRVDRRPWLLLGIAILVQVLVCFTGNTVVILLGGTLPLVGLAVYGATASTHKGQDISIYLLVATLMSAFQNVYLGLMTPWLSESAVKGLIVLNFVFAAGLLLALMVLGRGAIGKAAWQTLAIVLGIALIVFVYGMVQAVAQSVDLLVAFAAARNLTSPFLFLALGLVAATWTTAARYMQYVVYLAIACVFFGVLESLIPGFWGALNLDHLWELKSIPVNPDTGLPGNFYSSERVAGEPIRRMVGPFADPVNLGSFLFVALVSAWFLRKRAALVIIAIGTTAAVSKGALLTAIVWLIFWANAVVKRIVFWILCGAAALGAVGFYIYTLIGSSGSTQAHIDGFLAAIIELPAHPWGSGFGSVGVMSGLLNTSEVRDSGISESGLGVVIGQLGVIGLVAYIALYIGLFWLSARLPEKRERILAYTLTAAFFLNSAFNEVALSPHSSATYFLLLGLLLGQVATRARQYGRLDL